ncbi:MAG: sigma-70 family RNA polymerase sigma factor [Desulfobacteraceae bacterium]|nr:sigma-70 family RNA polymerase sigma factor [Desulfobacteraceae bacterium]
MLDNKSLIWKLRHSDKNEALWCIYAKYKDDLVTLAGALLNNRSDAEDVVHDVFVSFIKTAAEFQFMKNLRAYLSTCVVNNARNRNKAVKRHRSVPIDETKAISSEKNKPDDSVILAEELQQLNHSLAQLTYEQREVIALHLLGMMKFRTISEIQGISISTVQSRYQYGLDKLRSILNGEVGK